MRNLFLILFSGVLIACASPIPLTVGMTKEQVVERQGQPAVKWIGAHNVECWKYEQNGTWYVIFKNDQAIKLTKKDRNFDSLVIGLPEAAVVELVGKPAGFSAIKNTKYLTYRRSVKRTYEDFFVRMVDGVVDAYGRAGDFDSTKSPENTLNINIDDKRKR